MNLTIDQIFQALNDGAEIRIFGPNGPLVMIAPVNPNGIVWCKDGYGFDHFVWLTKDMPPGFKVAGHCSIPWDVPVYDSPNQPDTLSGD
jgi:hypothetical protein